MKFLWRRRKVENSFMLSRSYYQPCRVSMCRPWTDPRTWRTKTDGAYFSLSKCDINRYTANSTTRKGYVISLYVTDE